MALPALPPKRSRLEGRSHPYFSNTNNGHGQQDHLPPLTTTSIANAAFDQSAFQVLIDRMFAHLSRETDVMREWVRLERDRLAQEIARRKEEKEREERREKAFLEVLTKLQEQVFTFLGKQQQEQQTSITASTSSLASSSSTQQPSSSTVMSTATEITEGNQEQQLSPDEQQQSS